MGKPTGFVEGARAYLRKRDVTERTLDHRELVLPVLAEEAAVQAGRCMDCGVPFCHQGCPLGNVIPDFNDLVYRGRWREAYDVLASTNDLPEVTGRVCPAPCETACVLAIDPAHPDAKLTGASQAVTIEQIERTIADRAFAEGWVQPRRVARPSGKRVAIVGSGPAGLAAASQLVVAGHEVHVYERDERAGGLLRFGIPDFKLEKHLVERRVALLEAEGVRFHLGADVGHVPSWSALREQVDALVIAIGAQRARTLDVPGADLDGVVLAMRYLSAQNRANTSAAESAIDLRDRRVLVLGGGDTGSDCVGTAHRQGAREVLQVELMPTPPTSRERGNPWPQWPLVFRTSSSHEEGGARHFGRRTTHLEGKDGRLVALRWIETRLEAGRLVDVPGTSTRVEVDALVLALGFVGPDTTALEQLGVELDSRGAIAVDSRRQTSAPGVFCAGDANRGASLVVWAISDGRETARFVDEHLTNRTSALPTRGVHQPFGGR